MRISEHPTSKEVRDFKIKEIEKRITTNQFYLSIAFQANGFFYLTTGVVLGYYLNQKDSEYLVYFLLLPILLGTVLGGIFIYGASLNKEASNIIEGLRTSLDEDDRLDVGTIPDVNLLHILLRIFGYILLLVVATLIALPFLIRLPVTSTSTIGWFFSAGFIILVAGAVSSHYFAWKQYKKLQGQKEKSETESIATDS